VESQTKAASPAASSGNDVTSKQSMAAQTLNGFHHGEARGFEPDPNYYRRTHSVEALHGCEEMNQGT
jgi:hypothetical protein